MLFVLRFDGCGFVCVLVGDFVAFVIWWVLAFLLVRIGGVWCFVSILGCFGIAFWWPLHALVVAFVLVQFWFVGLLVFMFGGSTLVLGVF